MQTKGIVALLCILSAAIALLLAAAQQPFPASTFEYQSFRPYRGGFVAKPYPMLLTPAGQFLLVAPGKHGFIGLPPGGVELRGAYIGRDGQSMLEVEPGSPRTMSTAIDAPQAVDLGEITLHGEIVDSKCYLGVMNPGQGKVHRDCAARCISGGIPPAFLVRDRSGRGRVLLLTGADGRAIGKELLQYVAEPLAIHGRLSQIGAMLILAAEPRTFRRE